MILYAVQWHSMPLPPHADENDLDWTTWRGHDDYLDAGEADAAAREFDAAFDGAYIHRVVARRVDSPSVARARPPAQATRSESIAPSAQAPRRARRP
ncbi:MAG TPA: hypothetical protein VMG12_14470 [Polyangiaceae bacterium]|nr:hypothetical protein [Polyangiaceae bacterium]